MTRATFIPALRAAAQAMRDEARAIKWRDDPVAWAEDVLGVVFWSKQKEILRSLAKNKRTAVKSSHSIGKTFTCAVASVWWVSTRDDCMVQSTAPTYNQVHSLLWEEIRKLHTRADLKGRVTLGDQWLVPYKVGNRMKEGLRGEGKKPADTNIHGFQGTHRPDGVLAILDEACGLAETIYTGARAVTTASFDRILAVGNPDDPNTEFGRIFRESAGQWNLITVSAYDTPNFTDEAQQLREWAVKADAGSADKKFTAMVEQLLGGLPQPDDVQEMLDDWGKDSPRALSKVFAQFPTVSMDSLFSASDIEKGVNEVIPEEDLAMAFRVLGVDVARYGTDKSVICQNIGGKIAIVGAYSTMDTMELAATIHKHALDRKIDQVRVDGVGVGGGVLDRLVQLSHGAGNPYSVVEMTAQSNPPDRTLHRNARAYWYDSLKHQLRSSKIDLPNEGDYSDVLRRELGSIKYKYPGGVLQIESKEDIRARGDKSPDFVDALVMSTAPVNYIADDPLATMRKGQTVGIDVLSDIELVSPY